MQKEYQQVVSFKILIVYFIRQCLLHAIWIIISLFQVLFLKFEKFYCFILLNKNFLFLPFLVSLENLFNYLFVLINILFITWRCIMGTIVMLFKLLCLFLLKEEHYQIGQFQTGYNTKQYIFNFEQKIK